MSSRPRPSVPDSLPMAEAMRRSTPLAQLAQRMRDSQARFDAIAPSLPLPLRAQVRPGPVDEDGWSLMAANAAVAAKLRQLKPRLEMVLTDRGWQASPIRIKVQSR